MAAWKTDLGGSIITVDPKKEPAFSRQNLLSLLLLHRRLFRVGGQMVALTTDLGVSNHPMRTQRMAETEKNRSSRDTASFLPCLIVMLFIVVLFYFQVLACCYSGCYTCRLQIFGKDHCSPQSNSTLYLMTIYNDFVLLGKGKKLWYYSSWIEWWGALFLTVSRILHLMNCKKRKKK